MRNMAMEQSKNVLYTIWKQRHLKYYIILEYM